MTGGVQTEPARQRTALVAGGAGFLGSHLCEALLGEGASVICVDNLVTGQQANVAALDEHPRFRFIRHDVMKALRIEEPVTEIYNLASAASPPRYQARPVHTLMTNVAGTANLLAMAQAKGATFLQASTSEVYGDPEVHPQPESYRGHVNCTGPRACYDEGKRAAEALCFDFLRSGRADVRVARIFNTYGPRMDPEDGRVISNLIMQACAGQPLTVHGSGSQTRSFCYVDDLIAGLLALMRVEPNPMVPVNLGNPGEITVHDVADMILARMPHAGDPVFRPLPQDDPQRRCPDISLAGQLLGWQPRIAFEDGLERTIAWFSALHEDKPGENPQPPYPMDDEQERDEQQIVQ